MGSRLAVDDERSDASRSHLRRTNARCRGHYYCGRRGSNPSGNGRSQRLPTVWPSIMELLETVYRKSGRSLTKPSFYYRKLVPQIGIIGTKDNVPLRLGGRRRG